MGLSISGLGSGYDWQSIVSQLKAVDVQSQVDPLNSQVTTLTSRLSAWKSLAEKLTTLQTAADNMRDTTDFDLFSTTLTSSSSSVTAASLLSASAGSGAGTGTYEIQVNQLAKAEKVQSVTTTSKDSSTGWTGSITLAGHDITLDGKSLISLRDEINALNTGDDPSGVVASILKVSSTDYRLTLTAEDTGAAGFSLTDAAGNYFVDTPIQAGADAKFTIDGVSFIRSSNKVTDAVPGVTLNLAGAEGDTPSTTVTLDVNTDTDAVKTKLQTFVDAYNSVIDYVRTQLSYSSDTKAAGGVLFGDSTLKSIKSNLQNLLLNSGLSDLGVTIGTNNKLTIDSDTLKSALQTDFSGSVTTLNNLAENFYDTVDNLTDSIDGTVTTRENSIQKNIDRLNDRITTTTDRIDTKMAALSKQYQAMDLAVSQLKATQSWLTTQMSALSSS